MKKRKLYPKDFIQQFSPYKKAELYINMRTESTSLIESFFLFQIVRKILIRFVNPNDREAEKIWKIIKRKWRVINSETVSKYLSIRFADDYLRKFEYSFLSECLGRKDVAKKRIIDLGGGYSFSTITPLLLKSPKDKIITIDVIPRPWKSKYNVEYVVGDCMNTHLLSQSADVVTIISTLEHVGLGRYGDPININGDILAMKEAWRILKKGGYLILTIPYGYPTVVYNLHRVYDLGRFRMISKGFKPIVLKYTLHGKFCQRRDIEGKRVEKSIQDNIYNSPGGILALLKKI